MQNYYSEVLIGTTIVIIFFKRILSINLYSFSILETKVAIYSYIFLLVT
jgi:hypothetical protein